MIETSDPRKEFLSTTRKRKALFISLGLRPYQISLSIGVLINLLAVIVAVVYLYSHGYKDSFRFSLISRPIVQLLVWLFHFGYVRFNFILLVLVGAEGVFGFVMRPRADWFNLSFLLGNILIAIGAGVAWAKMKDPIFSLRLR